MQKRQMSTFHKLFSRSEETKNFMTIGIEKIKEKNWHFIIKL